MQAAVVSVMLMAGACGGSPPAAADLPTPAVTCPACDSCPGGLFGDFSYGGTSADHTWHWHRGPLGCAYYTPVFVLHECECYYPGNYARPYDYRETFNYPWNGPRPFAAAMPAPCGDELSAAKPTLPKR